MTLQQFFAENRKVALGFSGGVDSSYLLYAGLSYGAEVRPYFIKTAFQPQFELDDANRLAKQLGVRLTVLTLDILSRPEVCANQHDRCYFCKRILFGALAEQAMQDGYAVLIDGNNASDDAEDRPGMRAVKELYVLSPLRLCGITKTEVRRLSKEADLFTWDKPAYACLATRLPAGQPITAGILQKVDQSEAVLFALGFTDFRLRIAGEAAKLQLPSAQMPKAIQQRLQILEALRPHFASIVLDMESRDT